MLRVSLKCFVRSIAATVRFVPHKELTRKTELSHHNKLRQTELSRHNKLRRIELSLPHQGNKIRRSKKRLCAMGRLQAKKTALAEVASLGIERIGGYRRIKKRRARCSLRQACRTNRSSLSHSLPIKKTRLNNLSRRAKREAAKGDCALRSGFGHKKTALCRGGICWASNA